MAKTKTKGTAKTVGDTPVPQPITISSTNPKIMADNIKKLEKAIKGADDASEISYDNTESHLTASNVQAAIDEVVSEIGSITSPAASDVSYDNTSSGLTADDVQEAIDEVNLKAVKKKKITYSNLANSDTTKYYIVLTSTPLVDIGDNATEILGITVTGFNGYPDITDRILPNAIMDSGSVLTVFEKGKTFSNVSLDITYIYR